MSLLPDSLVLGLIAGMARLSSSWIGRRQRGEEPETVCPNCEVCPLSSLHAGEVACLLEVGAGRRLRRRLAELGLTPGVEMKVLQNAGGPVLICVRNSRLALGREMAHKLDVRPIQGEDRAA